MFFTLSYGSTNGATLYVGLFIRNNRFYIDALGLGLGFVKTNSGGGVYPMSVLLPTHISLLVVPTVYTTQYCYHLSQPSQPANLHSESSESLIQLWAL